MHAGTGKQKLAMEPTVLAQQLDNRNHLISQRASAADNGPFSFRDYKQ